jgi:hypothetical protein
MLWAGRILSWVLIVTGGLVWTVGQAGLDSTDKNLCELASKIWQTPIEGCHIVPAFLILWQIAFWAALVFLIIDGYHRLTKQTSSKRQSIEHDHEIDFTAAVFWIMERSAWGSWLKTQYVGWPWETEKSRLREASNAIWKASFNGGLAVRGRLKNSLEYLAIDRDFWRSASLDAEPNNAALWKAIALVPGDIAIPDYDNFIVERTAVEALWPRYQWKYYWPIPILKIKAALKRKPRPMPEIDKKEETPPTPTEPKVIATPVAEIIPVPIPAPVTVVITPSPDAPDGWENLFVIGDDGRSIWLHFLPDTKDEKGDALLLIIYGHKVLLNRNRVNVHSAHAAVQKTVSVSPSKSYKGVNAFLRASWFTGTILDTEDYASKHIGTSFRRVGLSQGGMYELTEYGEREATGLAHDLIRRA